MLRAHADAMAATLAHRGPDQAGVYSAPRGAMASRRLAICDIPTGTQPMSVRAHGRHITVSFNGEIYNTRALSAELRAAGEPIRTGCEVETLAFAYAHWGETFLSHLDGQFAIAIFDEPDTDESSPAKCILARDRMGQKPLWIEMLPTGVAFASEPKALFAHPAITARWNAPALSHYAMLGYIPSPLSAFEGITKLEPGSVLTLTDRPAAPRRWYTPPAADELAEFAGASEEENIARVRELLERAVADRLMADPEVPVGMLLSGGVDSAIIAALMARASDRPVRTFTAGFAESEYDERPAAAALAKHIGAQHTELLITPDPLTAIDQVAAMYDEPFADSSALATHLICQAASEHVTVALVGDGGDEVFGGYDRYRAMQLADSLSPPGYLAARLAGWLAGAIAPHRERNKLRRFARFAKGLPLVPATRYLNYRNLFPVSDLQYLFTEDYLVELAETSDGPDENFCEQFADCDERSDNILGAVQRHDMSSYLPDDLLVKADIASMAHSLELRAPMLDHRIIAMGLGLPAEQKIAGRRGKHLLHKAFCDLVPPCHFDSAKRGFGVPLAAWLRGPLRELMVDRLTSSSFLEGPGSVFQPRALLGLMNDHLDRTGDHSHRLWALLILEASFRRFS
jgi:asparagine synthase (glutamine-hydrolysing)